MFNFRVQTQCFQFRTADVELQSVDCAETMILATAENSIMLPDSFERRGLYRFTIFLKDTHKNKVDGLLQKEIRKSFESSENGDLKRISIY